MNLADNINIDGGADSWEPMVLSRQFAIYDPRMRRGDDSCKAFPWAEHRTREQCRKACVDFCNQKNSGRL